MQKVLGILLVIILLSACKKEQPEGILPPSEMTDLLYDLHLADAYSNTASSDTSRKKRTQYFHSVFQKYKIDSAGFRHNLEYYAAQPATLQDMYAEISKRYRALEEVFTRERDEKTRAEFRADSLKRVHYQDSIKQLSKDSLLYKRTQYLIYWKDPDSAHLRPPAWNVDSTIQDWMRVFYADSAQNMRKLVPEVKTDSSARRADENNPS